MPEINESIIINANHKKVLEVFHAFSNYSSWSKFIKSIDVTAPGKDENTVEVGDSLRATVFNSKTGKERTFTPLVSKNSNKRFAWKGVLYSSWIFGGEHSFEFEPLGENQTRVVQSEIFSGLLSPPLLWMIGEDTTAGFKEFNESLKVECEK